jgi:hypothetical protein
MADARERLVDGVIIGTTYEHGKPTIFMLDFEWVMRGTEVA